METPKINFVGSMLFLKFSILMIIIVSLTIVKPAASLAHKGAQKICSSVMLTAECVKHC